MKRFFSFKTALLVSCFTLAITAMSFDKASNAKAALGTTNTTARLSAVDEYEDENAVVTRALVKVGQWVGRAAYDITVNVAAAVVAYTLIGDAVESKYASLEDAAFAELTNIKMGRLG